MQQRNVLLPLGVTRSVWGSKSISQRDVMLPHYIVTIVLLAFVAMSTIGQLQRSWYIDFGTPNARIYATQLRESELITIDQKATTVQWSYADSQIPLPVNQQPQIIVMRTMMRAEAPPHAVSITTGQLTFDMTPAPGVRNYYLYSTHGSQITIRCNLQDIDNPELAKICVAVDWIRGQPATYAVDYSRVLWMVALITVVCGFAWTIATTNHPWLAWLVIGVLTTLFTHFLVPTMMYAPQLTTGVVSVALIWWCIQYFVIPQWQRVASQAMVVNVAIKGLGALVPGYYGTDLFFHVNRFVGVFSGNFYQIADGQGQVYPYPPGVYQLLAPLVLPLMTIFPTPYVMIFAAIIIDSSTIMILAWMCRRLAWSPRSITLMAWLYVILPAGFLLHWQATIAQNVGQWLGMLAIAASLWQINALSLIVMAWAVVGHFGAFLTLHLANTIAFTFRELRRMALWWWGVVCMMGVIFYSQYIQLISSQISTHYLNNTTAHIGWQTLWWDMVWKYGVFGHYLGIAVALALIGLCLAPRDRWWRMAVAMMTSTGVLLVAQVFGEFNATRYMIFVFPVVASFAGVALGRLQRGRAGRVMLITLMALIALHSCIAWFNGALFGIRVGFLW